MGNGGEQSGDDVNQLVIQRAQEHMQNPSVIARCQLGIRLYFAVSAAAVLQ
jgi:hypothetical protein